ncbi:MAG: hypothetical protein M1818_002300 [Claussenomyces sp. TS43310]|nr:MAG: hypothetical protein M1818_002300 [Claussenomyces sp. TS43310]
MVKNSSLRGRPSNASMRASIIEASEHPTPTPVKETAELPKPVKTGEGRSSASSNASPFATLCVGGATRFPWVLSSPGAAEAQPSPAQSSPTRASDRIDMTFRSLLQDRLDAARCQLKIPGLTQSVRWYLETEIRRIEGKLAEEKDVAGVNKVKQPEAYTQPFCDFLIQNPTVFHAVDYFARKLTDAGFKKLSERSSWTSEVEKGGKYFVERNGSSLIAFTVGKAYKGGHGIAMVAAHVDALTARLKPVSSKKTAAGYVQLGVAPYAGALNTTWWDRDLSIGGRVLVKDPQSGKITTKLVKLGWPIARIPTLAPHFGIGMIGQNNAETQAVPIIGLESSDNNEAIIDDWKATTLGGAGTFVATQPPRLVRAIAGELSIKDYSTIVNWELELYDSQVAQTGGLDKEFIFAGRIDDKLCSWSAIEGLLAASPAEDSGTVNLVGCFDDEEIGSLLRQGARGNFLPSVVERLCESLSDKYGANVLSQTYANSFLISADVCHAVNPNFLGSYLENHSPSLNVGLAVSADSNGHMTTDSVSTALLTRIAEKCGSKLQLFMIRNDSRSGGTVGPMLSSAMGVRAIDAGIPQLSMHSIRATTGSLDPGLGAKLFAGFFDHFEEVDKEFE